MMRQKHPGVDHLPGSSGQLAEVDEAATADTWKTVPQAHRVGGCLQAA